MSIPVVHDYIGLSETCSMERSCDNLSSSSSSSPTVCEKNNVLKLKETELRLGLPGSWSPERKADASGLSLFGKDLEDSNTYVIPLRIFVSGAKRGFYDTIDAFKKDKGVPQPPKPVEEKKSTPANGHKLWDGHQLDLFARTPLPLICRRITRLRGNQEQGVFMLKLAWMVLHT